MGWVPVEKLCRGLKGAVTVTSQHAHIVVRIVGRDQVGFAVSVDVEYCHGARPPARGEVLCDLEGAVPIAKQNANRAGKLVGGEQVGFAVTVYVRHFHIDRRCAEVLRSLESAIAIAQ